MVQKVHVEGHEAFKEAVGKQKGKEVFVLFSGSVDADGKNWCPDCVAGQSGVG